MSQIETTFVLAGLSSDNQPRIAPQQRAELLHVLLFNPELHPLVLGRQKERVPEREDVAEIGVEMLGRPAVMDLMLGG